MAFPVSASASERSNHKLSINIDKNPTLNGLFGLGNYAFAPNSQLFEPRMHCRGRLGGLKLVRLNGLIREAQPGNQRLSRPVMRQ
jgi:hypothetical protein